MSGPLPSVSVSVNAREETPAAGADPSAASRPAEWTLRPTIVSSVVVAALGVAIHNGCLTLVERFVSSYPHVHDVVEARLPYVEFGPAGEVFFAAVILTFILVIARFQARSIPRILTMLGAFYALRGVFLLLLPIGSPVQAPALAARFALYPFASHAYFPGGHVGVMTTLSLSVRPIPWRRAFFVLTALFALGTILARTHYTADVLGGWMLAYAIVKWSQGHLAHPATPVPSRPA
jgi:membrane-associated phospholipid phosphatase